MKQETEVRLDSIFRNHEASKLAAEQAKQAVETKEQAFLRAFLTAREDIIRPAMQAIGDYIKARGYNFRISVEEDGYEQGTREGRPRPASIGIKFLLGSPAYGEHQFPGLSVFCNKSKQVAWFHESTMAPGRGGHAGSTGEVSLSELTEDLVQSKLLNIVAEVFK